MFSFKSVGSPGWSGAEDWIENRRRAKQREDAQGAAASGRGNGGGNGGSPVGFFGAMFSGWGGKEKRGEERLDSSTLEDDTASSCDDDSTPWNKHGDAAVGLYEENPVHYTYEDKDYHYGSQGGDRVGEDLGDEQATYGGQSSTQSGGTQSGVMGARVASRVGRVTRVSTPRRSNNVSGDYALGAHPESQQKEGGSGGNGGGDDGGGGRGGSGDSDSSALGDDSDSVHQSGDVTLHLSALTADDEMTL